MSAPFKRHYATARSGSTADDARPALLHGRDRQPQTRTILVALLASLDMVPMSQIRNNTKPNRHGPQPAACDASSAMDYLPNSPPDSIHTRSTLNSR